MKPLLIAFIFCLTAQNYAISQENLIDSIQIDKIVRLINDFKACEEYSQELELRLIDARTLIGRTVKERNDYKYLVEELDQALSDMTSRKLNIENNLKRTRAFGIFGTIGGFIVGVFVVLMK